MAKEFDIEKIERAGEESVPKLMTGAYTKELSPKTEVEPNAEIEKGEYIMYPDGITQKAIGESHANGGMMMNLPDGTRVLSNFLKPSSETKKILKDNFGLKVEKHDTYSKILDKFLKKIGYEKIIEEQEEAFESLRKLLDKKTIDKNTLAVNREFLSKKIFDIETKKLELEESKKEMFDLLYNEQEDTKSQKETNEDGEYKYGGLKRSKFEEVCRKNDMTVEEGMKMLSSKKYERGGSIPKYENGTTEINQNNASDLLASGEITQEQYVNAMYSFYGDEYNPNNDPNLNPERSMANRISPSSDSFNLNIGYQQNIYSGEAVVHQLPGEEGEGYGNIENAEDALNALYGQFPDIVLDIFGSDVKVEQGRLKLTNKDLKFNKPNPKVGQLQKRMNDRMNASAKLILSNKNASEEQKKAAQEYLDKQTFYTGDLTLEGVTEEQKVRSYSDAKLGQFTSGRFVPNVDLLTPEEIKKAKDKGYTTAKQVKADKEFYESLSPESKNRFNSFGDLGEADFFITDYKPVVAEEELLDQTVVPKPNFPKMFAYPSQYVRPPMGMQATLFPEARLSRIDPLRISPEQTLQAISDSRQFTADQFADLNPMQRASALSQMTGQAMLNEARAIRDTNVMNAQYQTQADLFNIGQRDKEGLLGAQNALGYEARTFTALDKTDKNMRDWELYNNKQSLAEYDYNRKLNLLDSIFPDFSPNFLGNRIMFDPSAPYSVDMARDIMMFMPSIT
jgi:hypothetical protein